MSFMCIIVSTPPWYVTKVPGFSDYQFWWHVVASFWWLCFMHVALHYFQLFECSSALALALPKVFFNDMVPWSSIYLTMFACTAVALRVSTTHSSAQAEQKDTTVGTFIR